MAISFPVSGNTPGVALVSVQNRASSADPVSHQLSTEPSDTQITLQ